MLSDFELVEHVLRRCRGSLGLAIDPSANDEDDEDEVVM